MLHIFSGFGGGISSLILNLTENKDEEFIFDIMAFSYKNGDEFIKKMTECNARCYTMPRPAEKGYRYFERYVDSIMRDGGYDVVHCHIAGIHAIPFEYLAKKNNIKVFIIHAHTTYFDSAIDRNWISRKIGQYENYKNSTCYMTCSDMAANYVYGSKYLKKRSPLLIPNGIKKDLFLNRIMQNEIDDYRQQFQINCDTKIILHVGRFSPPKNHSFIIDIARGLKEKGCDFVFLLVGAGELLNSVRQAVSDYNLSTNVKFLGHRTDIAKLMQFADCMILPSFYEGLPTVAIECQAAGTEIFVSDKITRQCNLGLGLVKFLSIDSVEPWVNELSKDAFTKSDIEKCIEVIDRNGFTSAASGKYYCNAISKLVKNMTNRR